MMHDTKHTNPVKAWLNDREYLDLCRQADREDRRPGELLHLIVRRHLYGIVVDTTPDGNGPMRPATGRAE